MDIRETVRAWTLAFVNGLQCRATIDFESRSACAIKLGAHIYSIHPSTEIMCLSVRLPYWPHGVVKTWHPAYPHLGIEEEGQEVLAELFRWIELGGLVEAHNAGFEKAMWRNVCVKRMGWPTVPQKQWRCSAAKCAVHTLPRSLEGAGVALKLKVKKDLEGAKVMKKLCKPRKPKKQEIEVLLVKGIDPDSVIFWHESVEDFQKLWAYCEDDVRAEEAISEALPDLSESELRIWLMDQDMNERGVLVDTTMAAAALKISDQYKDQLNAELKDITGIEAGTKRADIKHWLFENGINLPDTTGDVVDQFLAMKGLKADQHRVLFILREVNRTSTSKYKMALAQADPADGRARDQLMYCGAGTGRWTGKGMQVHNFKKGFASDLTMGDACDIISVGQMRVLVALYGNQVMEVLADAIRGVLIAPPGRDFMVADFAAIEARVVLWLARQMSALEVFERGECIYCDMAGGIYGYPVRKGIEKDERQFGKQAILGLGFEMGFVTFLATCYKYDIKFSVAQCKKIVGAGYDEEVEGIRKYFQTDTRRRMKKLEDLEVELEQVIHELALMRYTVKTYRGRYPEVSQMWRDQEKAAIAAVRTPGRVIECERGRNSWVVEGDFLKTILPSGRPLYYPEPKILSKAVPWNKDEKRPVLTFMEEFNKKWLRTQAYGGLLVENITQATARDLMAEAMVKADDHPDYDVIMSVHDELVCEVDEGVGDVKAFERMMSETPAWARDCPVDAEGWRGKRYRK